MSKKTEVTIDAEKNIVGKDLTDEKKTEVDKAAEDAKAPSEIWKYKLKEPFEYQGETYTELEFDFGKLLGRDIVAIEHELEQLKINPFSHAGLSDSYAERAAGLACENIHDMFALEELWGADYNAVMSHARSFLSSFKMTETVPLRVWKVELKKPFEKNGKTYTELEFDYRKIKGKHLLKITSELEDSGRIVSTRFAASFDYSARVALEACDAPLEVADLEQIGAAECNEIVTRAKLFLAGLAV